MKDARKELRRLIIAGLRGRTFRQLWESVCVLFKNHGEVISWSAFEGWTTGDHFPSTKLRQNLLGDAVGGMAGAAIKAIPAPAFRGWRQSIMRDRHMIKKLRTFPLVSRPDESGKMVRQAEIVCAECGFIRHHSRRGSLEDEEYFRNKGWTVGTNKEHDFCPQCTERRRKVVKMADHRKDPPVIPPKKEEEKPREMTKEDGRLIWKAIENRWDDNNERYQIGWSDAKVAEKEGVPVDWVKAIRERDYGGVGEDPQVHEFIAEALSLNNELSELDKHFQELAVSVADAGALQAKVGAAQQKSERLLDGYKDKHTKLATKVHRLNEVAEKAKLLLPFPANKAG